jgi:hypothetical protein
MGWLSERARNEVRQCVWEIMSVKRIFVIAGLSLFSIVNVASAEGRGRRGDCDNRNSVRASNQIRDARYGYGYRNDDYRYRQNRNTYSDRDYRYSDRDYRRDDDRSTAASVGIVAGSAAGGAAIGGLAGGMKGAAIGAIAGGAAGLVYDQATRDGDRDRNRRYRR